MGTTMTFRILGCGASPGTPRIGNDWGRCDPHEPKNRRRRSSLLVTRTAPNGATTRVLVDVGADVREQMLEAHVDWVDAVLITHAHADHIHGIDDLRAFAINRQHLVDIWMDEVTSKRVRTAFDYCFVTPPGSAYPPILKEHRYHEGETLTVNGDGGPITAIPFRQTHGDVDSFGFRFGTVAYSPDVSAFPDRSLPFIGSLDLWILDALRWKSHPSHLSVDEAVDWIARMKPKHACLTHLHTDIDYKTLADHLPEGVEPAWDGLEFTFKVD